MDKSKIELLLKINQKAKEKGKEYPKKRYLFKKIFLEKDKKTIAGVSGLRGSGKTVILFQLANILPSAFYFSCDTATDIKLYDLADFLIKNYKIKYFLIDEIHYQHDWEKQLKLIYDFLKIKVYFTSSVSLNILKATYDLSRRAKVIELPIFSFSEYLYFKYNLKLPLLTIEKIIKNYQALFKKYYEKEAFFSEYLNQPIPCMLEDPSFQLIKQVAEKIITKDLFYHYQLTALDIEALKNIVVFIANTPIAEVNYSILSKNLGITKYKVKKYVDYLEKSYLLKSIFPYSSCVIKEPKIVLNLPFRKVFNYRLTPEQLEGALREEFFVQSLARFGTNLYYLKSTRGKKTPDYLSIFNNKKYAFEIGGRKKGFSQFKGLEGKYEKFIVTYPGICQKNKISLILFGML